MIEKTSQNINNLTVCKGRVWVYNKEIKKMVRRARFIMEQNICRKLKFNEIVHHINGNTIDDRLLNLQIMSRKEHTSKHKKLPLEIKKERKRLRSKKYRNNHKEYYKQYELNRKDKQKKYNKIWREKNKEYVKEYYKQYRIKNKDKLNKQQRRYRKCHQ